MPVSLTSAFRRAYPPATPDISAATAYHLPFVAQELIVAQSAENCALIEGPNNTSLLPVAGSVLFLGTLNGVPCLAYRVAGTAEDDVDLVRFGLRELYDRMPDRDMYAVAGYALQLLHFQSISHYDPVNGEPTEPLPGTWARTNANSGHESYPPVSPAVLILVHDGADKILLAQKSNWGKRYSILAGFVEPGESLEECATREAYEEAGVVVVDPIYDGSQPWPFPHQIMIGMTVRCTNADEPLVLDETELARAAWFGYDALPELPPKLSLSRQMIDRWAEARRRFHAAQ